MTLVVDDYDPAIRSSSTPSASSWWRTPRATTSVGWSCGPRRGRQTGLLLARAADDDQAAAVGHQAAGRVGFFLQVDDFEVAWPPCVRPASSSSQPRTEPYGQVAVFATSPATAGTCSARRPSAAS